MKKNDDYDRAKRKLANAIVDDMMPIWPAIVFLVFWLLLLWGLK